jgi:hypothetical protein
VSVLSADRSDIAIGFPAARIAPRALVSTFVVPGRAEASAPESPFPRLITGTTIAVATSTATVVVIRYPRRPIEPGPFGGEDDDTVAPLLTERLSRTRRRNWL